MKSANALPLKIEDSRAFKVLDRARASQRLGQALLLYGESLQTLEATALTVAHDLLGGNPGQTALDHPDCFTLRAANKMRQINAAAPRALIRTLQHSSNQGGAKVALVYEAERMHTSSANAFLKTLEEPPAGTYIFLLSVRPYDLLDTIRSRCQFFRVPTQEPAVNSEEWQHWLEQYGNWIQGVVELNARDNDAVTRATLGVYSLVYQFEGILSSLASTAWQQQEDQLDTDTLTSEQLAAKETGTHKALRQKLLKEIEIQTRTTGYSLLDTYPQKMTALHRSVSALEHATGLLEVNLKETTALETFLLQSLRFWTAN